MIELRVLIARCLVGACVVALPVACSNSDDSGDDTTTTADDPTDALTAPDGVSAEDAETFADDFRLAAGRTGVEGFGSVDSELVQFSLDEAARVCAAVSEGAEAGAELDQAVAAFEDEFVNELEGEPDALAGGWRDAAFQTAADVLCPDAGGEIIGALSGSGD